MTRLLLSASLALTLSCGAAFAQQTPDQTQAPTPQTAGPNGPHHHTPNPERQAAMIGKKLNLTPDQTAKLEPILANRDQQMQAVWQNQQLAPEERHQQMKSINEQTQQQLSTVLSPDQMAQLKAMRRHHMHHGQPGDDGQPVDNGQNGQAPSA